jgi:hypothetical protein
MTAGPGRRVVSVDQTVTDLDRVDQDLAQAENLKSEWWSGASGFDM